MTVLSYKCPCCSSPLAFSGESGKLECASCGNSFAVDALEALSQSEGGEQHIDFAMAEEGYSASEAGQLRAYTCEFCGAELLTDENTTATTCAYCGSPAILPAKIESGVKPEKVLPFTVTKEQAEATFAAYFQGKRLLPNIFLTTQNRIAEMRKLYVPYWLFGCEASADIAFDAETTSVSRQGDWEIRKTRHYLAHRKGGIAFDDIPVDGSVRLDDKIGESLEPYDFSAALPFAPGMLSGAMADNADVKAEVCRERAVERLEESTKAAFEETVEGYDRVDIRSCSIRTKHGKATPVLLPVWMIETTKEENGRKKTYTFAINGQTGALTCDVPHARGKAWAWRGGIFAGVALAGYLLLVVLKMLGVIG